MDQAKVIFFGNGKLADYALKALKDTTEVIFHARTREDISEACRLKKEHPEAHGVLASFGVMIKPEVLELFEPEGILNIHPSLLPKYRGASPIESAILAGDTEFGVSVMKLAREMDAGPVYGHVVLEGAEIRNGLKDMLYQQLAGAGESIIYSMIYDSEKPLQPRPQEGEPSYCGKLDKSMSQLTPDTDTAEQTFRKILAYQGYPKPKFTFYGVPCIILEAHIAEEGETAPLTIKCADGRSVVVEKLQPEGRKAMDAKAFLNGYKK
ncbi:methionyl-tRNA formyltransferase [Candidatus Saccharibacteria bacterium]|nr:methionyl-tRNA formyltransferase [Candidatus Saccharibacteria bacterium]